MTPKIFSAMATAATVAFVSLGTVATAQAAPHTTVVVQGAAHAHGQPVYLPVHQPSYQPGYQPSYQPGYRPGHRSHSEAGRHGRPGHTWVAGHWQQRGQRAVWQEGHWQRSRPAYRPGYGAVHYPSYPGHSNGHDAQPRPPRWDRDGDGVPNRHDRRPNNPHRY